MSTAEIRNMPAFPKVSPLGVDGLLVSFGDQLGEAANRAALAFRAALDASGAEGLEETSTSLTSVYLRFDLARTDHQKLHSEIAPLLGSRDWFQAALPQGCRLWRVPAAFDVTLAPQFEEAAALAGLTPAKAVEVICAAPLRVQTIGFAPGQPYLGELPKEWDIPRQKGLTPRVPEGALVVAIRQMVLFSVETPTGWRHVGQTALRLFQPDRPDPFLLRPGDEVQFQPVSAEALATIRQRAKDGGAVAEQVR